MTQDKPLQAIGAYIFAGGFTVGVKQHFEVGAHLEESDYGTATAMHNFKDLPIVWGPENWPLESLREEYPDLDLLYGNPPCAAWSVAGYTKTRGKDKWRTDPRVQCTVKHFNLLKELRPKIWVWESVTQAFSKGQEFVRTLEQEALELGYSVTYLLHDAQWFGLPQSRKRFMMICHRVALPFPAHNWAPPPTVLETLDLVPEDMRVLQARDVEGWSIKSFPKEVLENVPAGTRLRNHWEEMNPEETRQYREDGACIGRPSYGHCRLPLEGVSGAVVGYGLVHPTEHRFISIKEMQVLCGFPVDFEFVPAGAAACASEIARGVCPPVGEWFARMCAQALRHPLPFKQEVRVIDHRRPIDDGSYETPLEPERPIEAVKLSQSAPAKKVRVVKAVAYAPDKPQLDIGPEKDEGSGSYIRRLLAEELYTNDEIVALVHSYWPESKASAADVSYHRGKMRRDGGSVRVIQVRGDGKRVFLSE